MKKWNGGVRMNKQEFFNSVIDWGVWCTDHNTGEKDRYVKIYKVRELIEQLDEQPKVTVPQFLAKFIQDNKGNSASDIFSQDWFHESVDETDDEVNKWLYDNDTAENDRRYLIAVQAFVTGEYEVEKEPLYQIQFPGTSWGAYLTKADNGDLVIFQNADSGSNFTESEIKSIDERYWAFAVQVEEV